MSITAIGFVAIYVSGLGLAFFVNPIFGLLTYLWAFYGDPPSHWWGDDLPDLRWSLAAAIVTLVSTARNKRSQTIPWYSTWPARFLILYAGWAWIQTIWAVNQPYHVEGAILFTKYVVLYGLIYIIAVDPKALERLVVAHIAGCLVWGWMAYTMTVSGRLEGRFGPGIDDSNVLATHLAVGLAFAGFLFVGLQGLKRWISLGAIPFILNAIILTASRGAFVGAVGAGMAAAVFAPRVNRRIVLGCLALGGVLLVYLGNNLFWERISTSAQTDEAVMDASASSRLAIAQAEFKMFLDFPFGAGHRGNEVLSPGYMPPEVLTAGEGGVRVRSAHNTFLAVLVDQGIPGVILYLALLVWVAVSLIRLRPAVFTGTHKNLSVFRGALASSFAVVLVSGQFINLLKFEMTVWLFAILAVLQSFPRESISSIAPSHGQRVIPEPKSETWTIN